MRISVMTKFLKRAMTLDTFYSEIQDESLGTEDETRKAKCSQL